MFDWRAYLALADELAQRTDEAAARAAISRAYYVAFHRVRDYLNAKRPPVPEEGRAHQVVWNRVRNIAGPTPKRVAEIGTLLKVRRRSADYDAVYAGNDVFADGRASSQQAHELLDVVDELPPS